MQKELKGPQQLPSLMPFSKALEYSRKRTSHLSCGKEESLQVTQHPAEATPCHPLLFIRKRYKQQYFYSPKKSDAPSTKEDQTTSMPCSLCAVLHKHSSLFPQHWAVSNTIKLNSCSLQLFLSKIQRSLFFSFPLYKWDCRIFLINIQHPHQNKMGVKARLLAFGSAPCLYFSM